MAQFRMANKEEVRVRVRPVKIGALQRGNNKEIVNKRMKLICSFPTKAVNRVAVIV